MKPTSIIYLVLSVILIASGYLCMETGKTLAETEGSGLYSDIMDEEGNRVSTLYYSSEDYDRVEVNVSDANVYLCVGDEEKVVLKNYTEGSFTESKVGVSYLISDNMSAIDMITSGNFNLSFKGLRHYWHDRELLSRQKEVYVYTTEDTVLNGIDIVLRSGNISIQDYRADFDVMAHVDSGAVSIIKSSANAFNITGGDCTLSFDEVSAPRLHADIKSGNISMKGSVISSLTKFNIKEAGEVSADLTGPESDYVIVASASKYVMINGKKMGTQYPVVPSTPDSDDTAAAAVSAPAASADDNSQSTAVMTVEITVEAGTVIITTQG